MSLWSFEQGSKLASAVHGYGLNIVWDKFGSPDGCLSRRTPDYIHLWSLIDSAWIATAMNYMGRYRFAATNTTYRIEAIAASIAKRTALRKAAAGH